MSEFTPAGNVDTPREILELNSLSPPKVYQQFFWCYRHGRIHSDLILSIPLVAITIYCETCQIESSSWPVGARSSISYSFLYMRIFFSNPYSIFLWDAFPVCHNSEQQRWQCWCTTCEQFGTGLKSLVGFVRASEKLEVNILLQAWVVLISICHNQWYVFAFLRQLSLMQEKCPLKIPAYFFFHMSACTGPVFFLLSRIHWPELLLWIWHKYS